MRRRKNTYKKGIVWKSLKIKKIQQFQNQTENMYILGESAKIRAISANFDCYRARLKMQFQVGTLCFLNSTHIGAIIWGGKKTILNLVCLWPDPNIIKNTCNSKE